MTRPTLAERIEASRAEDLFEERAGILEHQAGFSRVQAELRARCELAPLDPSVAKAPVKEPAHQVRYTDPVNVEIHSQRGGK